MRWVGVFVDGRRLDLSAPAGRGADVRVAGGDVEVDIERQACPTLDIVTLPLERPRPGQHKLHLCEEIKSLVDILKDDDRDVDLHREWARIVSLLSVDEGGGAEVLGGESHRQQVIREVVSVNQSATDRDKEILWMVKLLVEKLCSCLREDMRCEGR